MSAEFAVINVKDLFSPKFNPSGRMDASFGIWLANMLNPPKAIQEGFNLKDLFSSRGSYKVVQTKIRKAASIEEVEDILSNSLLKYDLHNYSKTGWRESLDPRIVKHIQSLASLVCDQQADQIASTISDELEVMNRLKSFTSLAK